MSNKKPLIRRTFRQERFDILIKKQRNGNATFNDLTELDDIVNRDPEILESILEEMQEQNNPPDIPEQQELVMISGGPKTKSLSEKFKALLSRLFIVEDNSLKALAAG